MSLLLCGSEFVLLICEILQLNPRSNEALTGEKQTCLYDGLPVFQQPCFKSLQP